MLRPPFTIETLPSTGLVNVHEFVSRKEHRGCFPFAKNTWLRGVAAGDYPQPVKLHGVNHWHAEHIRAICTGRDWRDVTLEGEAA